MSESSTRLADDADRPMVERIWLMFRHDMSEFQDLLPNADGTFRDARLRSAFSDSDWAPYLLMSGDSPAGFAFVRGLHGPTRVLNSFFVVRGARRTGVGLRAVQEVVARHPGPWEVPLQEANVPALHFWRRVATEIAGETWTEERRQVPARPDLPPDVWVSFRSSAQVDH